MLRKPQTSTWTPVPIPVTKAQVTRSSQHTSQLGSLYFWDGISFSLTQTDLCPLGPHPSCPISGLCSSDVMRWSVGWEEQKGEGHTQRGPRLSVVLPVTPAVDEANILVPLVRHG